MPPHDIMSDTVVADSQPFASQPASQPSASQLDLVDSHSLALDTDLLKHVQDMEAVIRREEGRRQLLLLGSLSLQQAQPVLALLTSIPDVETVHTQFPALTAINRITDEIKRRFPHIASDQFAVNAYTHAFTQRLKEMKEREQRQQLKAARDAKRKAEEEVETKSAKRSRSLGSGKR